jgi:hypothetical protein
MVQHHKKLNRKQISLLHVIYRFRFVTSDLLAKYESKVDGSYVYNRLRTLEEQEYIGKKYEPGFKLLGRPAVYFLMAKGIGALKSRTDVAYSQDVLHATYKDTTATDQFVNLNLAIFEAYIGLKAHYGERLQFFTKSDLATHAHDHFPQPMPDASLRLEQGGVVRQYFLDVHQESKPFFNSSQRVNQYAAHKDSKIWERTGEELPKIVAVFDSAALKNRLQKRLEKSKRQDLNFFLATTGTLKGLATSAEVWQSAKEPQKLTSLEDI